MLRATASTWMKLRKIDTVLRGSHSAHSALLKSIIGRSYFKEMLVIRSEPTANFESKNKHHSVGNLFVILT